MKFFIHLFGADVRRSWPVITAWLLTVAGAAAVDGIRPFLASNLRILNLVGAAGNLLWLTELLLLFVLIALVVQTHPLVGSDAFWMTRPIPPRTLLVSKLVLLGLVMVAVPVLAELVLMAAYQVPARQSALVAADTALTKTMIVILLMTAAAMTRNFSRFAVLCGSALGAVAIAISIAVTILMSRADAATATLELYSSATGPMPGDEDPTGAFLWSVLVPMVGFAVLAVQYRTRSRARAVALGVVGLLLVTALVDVWRWPFLQPRVVLPEWTAAAQALRLSADPSSSDSREDGMFGRSTPWTLTRARVHLAGIEPGWSATIALLNASIENNGVVTLKSARAGFPAAVPIDVTEEVPTRIVVRDLLGIRRLIEPGPPKAESPVVFVTRGADASGSKPTTGLYQGRFKVTLTRHDVEATLPLTAGASHQKGSYRIEIDEIERTPGGVTLFARESRTLSAFDRTRPSLLSFYLRNREEGEALAVQPIDVREGPFLSRFMPFGLGFSAAEPSGFVARGLMIRCPPGYGIQEESPSIDDRWIAGAELVIVRMTREGSVARDLIIPGFTIG
jgi:hypothetical protein